VVRRKKGQTQSEGKSNWKFDPQFEQAIDKKKARGKKRAPDKGKTGKKTRC